MATFKSKLLTTVAIMPLALGGAAGAAFMLSAGLATPSVASCTANPCAAKKVSACNPCNPCAAKKASACNPCNPCNPCAAKNPLVVPAIPVILARPKKRQLVIRAILVRPRNPPAEL